MEEPIISKRIKEYTNEFDKAKNITRIDYIEAMRRQNKQLGFLITRYSTLG